MEREEAKQLAVGRISDKETSLKRGRRYSLIHQDMVLVNRICQKLCLQMNFGEAKYPGESIPKY